MTRLRGAVPVVIREDEWEETAEELDDMFLGDAEVWWDSYPAEQPPSPSHNPPLCDSTAGREGGGHWLASLTRPLGGREGSVAGKRDS